MWSCLWQIYGVCHVEDGYASCFLEAETSGQLMMHLTDEETYKL